MKKILLGLTIIIGVAVIIINIIPVFAKSSPASQPVKDADPAAPLVQIAPPVNPVPPAKPSSTPVKKLTAAPKPAVTKTTTTATPKSSVRWASSGLNAIGPLSSFDYSTSIRNAYKRKVEAYAKSKGITLITASVVNSMHQ